MMRIYTHFAMYWRSSLLAYLYPRIFRINALRVHRGICWVTTICLCLVHSLLFSLSNNTSKLCILGSLSDARIAHFMQSSVDIYIFQSNRLYFFLHSKPDLLPLSACLRGYYHLRCRPSKVVFELMPSW